MTSYLDNIQPPTNFNPISPPFNLLVNDLFLKVSGINSSNLDTSRFINITNYRQFIFDSFINHWKIQFGNNITPAIKLILPNRDSRLYYMKDLKLNHLLIKLLNIPRGSNHYNELINWKNQYHKNRLINNTDSDLPLLISKIISIRRVGPMVKPSLTIDDINDALDKLSTSSTSAQQISVLRPIIDKLTIEEIKWVFQIILKDSILSFHEKLFLSCWHPDAPDLFNICNDLPKIFNFLIDPSKRIPQFKKLPQLMYSFIPQLSRKIDTNYDDLCNKMIDHSYTTTNPKLLPIFNSFKGHFIIEEKLDGDRMILHMQNKSHLHSNYDLVNYKFFSRKRKDYTYLYGMNNHFGSLTSKLGGAFNTDKIIKNCILDGEMLAFDEKSGEILPFGILKLSAIQESVKQFKIDNPFATQGSHPIFIIFDILMINDADLTQLPLYYRKHLLLSIINPVPHFFEPINYQLASHSNDIKQSIIDVISSRSEGVMIKSIISKYHFAQRSNTWIKLKPEYLENFGENLDLIIIGKVHGQKKISFICGLIDTRSNIVLSFCKVANGFTAHEFDLINSQTNGKWHDFKRNPPPLHLIKFGTLKPQFWIDPSVSIVLEIKARSIDVSSTSTYAVGSTLHFLWCRSIRSDKLWIDCESLQLYEIKKTQYSTTAKKYDQKVNRKRRLKVDESFQCQNDRLKVCCKSNLFNNINFIILTDKKNNITHERISINQLSKLVKIHGGLIKIDVKSIDTTREKIIIISELKNPTTLIYLDMGFDIIKPDFIFECIRKNSIIPIDASITLDSNNENFKQIIVNNADQFGDCYIINKFPSLNYLNQLNFNNERLTRESLSNCQGEFINDCKSCHCDKPLIYLFNDIKFVIFTFTLDEFNQPWIIDSIMQRIKRYGGEITHDINDCSFIIIPNYYLTNNDSKIKIKVKHEINKISKKLADQVNFSIGNDLISPIPNIVNESFLKNCINDNSLIDPIDYKIN